MEYRWYIVKVIPGHENKVKRTLEEAIQSKGFSEVISEVALPSESVVEVKNGKQRKLEKRIYPGYLFLKMKLDDESHSFVKQVSGVKDFLGGSKPQPLSEVEMADMLTQVEERQKGGGNVHKIKVGDQVKIRHGAFESCAGTVTEFDIEKGSLKVLVEMFGRKTPIELEIGHVEPLSESN
jgi:transcriptional antiterminator NusG